MKMAGMTRSRGQVYSVGNYLMTGKVLGKGHFARVEEATHRIIGKKVGIIFLLNFSEILQTNGLLYTFSN